MIKVEKKLLKEYRCPVCNKLLGKGFLTHKDSYLQVKLNLPPFFRQ